MSGFGLYVKFVARPGQRAALVDVLLTAAGQTGAVPGCQLYVVNESVTEPDVVWVTEVWDSQAEHDASLTAPGAAELIQQALPLLAGPPERVELRPAGGKGVTAG
ncbi:putative quinol monooxygenase [Goodfellowiella coeruleoviolacea]|uniref:Quinol monooxygenase YgiN n=1 Tax=Goodfellowiella coeruleoviolacea TaxID=334858 RepID=A0AAE3GC00_9PSEU|nr:putative quinol monooxygenase [Goodfellowiella coeruleoviolacea]MCP2165018.1 Quinol monooxygenase YgiN [Goodfellowiella coeruleoviolacea]